MMVVYLVKELRFMSISSIFEIDNASKPSHKTIKFISFTNNPNPSIYKSI